MGVFIELYNVVVLRQSLEEGYPGGFDGYGKDRPNATYCYDDHLTRIGFMAAKDAVAFARGLVALGVPSEDIALVNQRRGITTPRNWLRWAEHEDGWGVCWLTGTDPTVFAAPAGWTEENARETQRNISFVTPEEAESQLEFLRTENNVDVYRDRVTGRLHYVGRVSDESPEPE